MHRSRLGVLLIDHSEAHDAAAAFWAGAAGAGAEDLPEEPEFTSLGSLGALTFAVQRTGPGTPPRMHLDIETDDVPAEVARVVALGATVVDDHGEHAVLRDPGGLVFCVVPVQSAEAFEAEARSWP
jgi:catechol 2,3-dioxygenase-like lactoylglutathione lyase family enzyme